MSEILALALRPTTLSSMVGQKILVTALRSQMQTRAPRAFLFSGGTGCGKTTIARIIAVTLQCTHQTVWGDPCGACWSRWNDFPIHEVNASEVNGVEEMGKIAEMSRYAPVPPGLMRVIILDECQRVTSAGQNLLLKPFEQVPKTTTWIICTTEPSKILPTLRRRCASYHLKGLSPNNREVLLKRIALKIGCKKPLDGLIDQIHSHQVNSPALILMALEKYSSGLSVEESVGGMDGSTTDSLRICKAVSSGDWKTLRDQLKDAQPEEARWIRSSVMGWIRGMLWRESNPKRGSMLAKSLILLSDSHAPLEDVALMTWLVGTLYDICQRMRT